MIPIYTWYFSYYLFIQFRFNYQKILTRHACVFISVVCIRILITYKQTPGVYNGRVN